jgi:Zn-finger nucleic acid-binding protein
MPELEPRYPCPVCLGLPLEKLSIAEASGLVLDYCRRCGGIWFDETEVDALRATKRGALGQRVRLTDSELRMAQAQLVGWLEGLFHGIQATLVAQQMAARMQLEQMRTGRPALPAGSGHPGMPVMPGTGQVGEERGEGGRTGQYL